MIVLYAIMGCYPEFFMWFFNYVGTYIQKRLSSTAFGSVSVVGPQASEGDEFGTSESLKRTKSNPFHSPFIINSATMQLMM